MAGENKRRHVIDQIDISSSEDKRKGIKKLIQLVKIGDDPVVIRPCYYTPRTNPEGIKTLVYSPWPPTFPPEEGVKVADAIAELVERFKAYLEIAESEKRIQRNIQTKGIYNEFSDQPQDSNTEQCKYSSPSAMNNRNPNH